MFFPIAGLKTFTNWAELRVKVDNNKNNNLAPHGKCNI